MRNKIWKAFLGLTGVGVIALTLGVLSAQAAYVPFPTSSSGNKLRVEYVAMSTCTTTPCTVTVNSSSSWYTNITRAGSGDYTLVIPSGVFSATPVCTCMVYSNSTGFCSATSISSTSMRFLTLDSAAGGTFTNSAAGIICMGPR